MKIGDIYVRVPVDGKSHGLIGREIEICHISEISVIFRYITGCGYIDPNESFSRRVTQFDMEFRKVTPLDEVLS